MKIAQVNYFRLNSLQSNQDNTVKNKYIANYNSVPAFTSFNAVLSKAVNESYTTDTKLIQDIGILFKEVAEKQNIHINPQFKILSDFYNKNGIRGLLYELWKSKPQELKIEGIDGEDFKSIPLVTQNGSSIFELTHICKYGASNNSPNWTTLTFQKQDGSELFEFGLNKKGELEITQTTPYLSIVTDFHRETGNIKVKIEQPKNGNQTVTYYNKSGQWSFFKNLFRGGTFIVSQ